ncbi:DUF1292 domain-containing protein [Selenomonas sputigena]|jgi:hypothetical protein|uniref:DUF1292 domain-containing protein n=2 Tax=Selenomonas TaxID=970 RepID=C9LRF6_SELS3|nr:DUF1292 domain-containing protein [Selenomonas sputigena]AEC00012.1 protein of unknown function DUF1292 [Selenomonas sputigena ATCC 35185]EEX78566.1 hypothetical protein SELSPUOL_00008 [Selenomonas sputigena ATCC 35185]UZD43556.1 DUF1292 domain-containing protein [Selenomonas sputigena]
MSDKEKEILDEDADVIVEMTDEEGNSYYYREEMIIPVGDDKFALLIGIHDEEEEEEHAHSCGCGCGEHDEDVLIAKVIMGDDGEEEYVEPTDEEFDAVQRAYDALMDDEEED